MKKKKHTIELKPLAIKDGKRIPREYLKRIYDALESLSDGLRGDVKKLTNYSPEYRLRVGNYRILFEIENDKITVYRIRRRKESYRER